MNKFKAHILLLLIPIYSSSSFAEYIEGQSELDTGTSYGTGETRFVGPNLDKLVTYDDKGDYGIIEGDIIVPLNSAPASIPVSNRGTEEPAVVISSHLWPNNTLYYKFHNASSDTKSIIRSAANHIASNTNVRFVELATASRFHVRITDTGVGQCNARVGYKVYQSEVNQGFQQLNLSRPSPNRGHCIHLGVAVHELMHSLGFWHEQSREDRNSFVTINFQNIRTTPTDYRFAFDQHISDGQDIRGYDYRSIMHYGAFAFSKNGKPTITPNNVSIGDIGQRGGMSSGDIAAMNQIYPPLTEDKEEDKKVNILAVIQLLLQ